MQNSCLYPEGAIELVETVLSSDTAMWKIMLIKRRKYINIVVKCDFLSHISPNTTGHFRMWTINILVLKNILIGKNYWSAVICFNVDLLKS